MSEIIYSKKYPHKSYEDTVKELEEQKSYEKDSNYTPPSLEEFYRNMMARIQKLCKTLY